MNNIQSISVDASHLKELARTVAAIDRRYQPTRDLAPVSDRFFQLMAKREFLPAPDILLKGTQPNATLLTGTGLKPTDEFDHLFNTLKQTSLLLQHGVAVAIDFSELRAARLRIGASSRQSLGPVRFMELFEHAPQDTCNKTPLTFVLNADHLDIQDFLAYMRQRPKHVRFALTLPNEFINALARSEKLGLKYKKDQPPTRFVDAHQLLRDIRDSIRERIPLDLFFTQNANEPGLILDSLKQLIWPFELTAAGALFLPAFVNEGRLDKTRLSEAITDSVHFLDNCLDLNFYVSQETKQATRSRRRLALTVIGLDETLGRLNPGLTEKKSLNLLSALLCELNHQAVKASAALGLYRGARNQILFKGRPYKTRNTQVMGQIDMPPLGELMGGLSYTKNPAWHHVWQQSLGNILPLRHDRLILESENFASKLLTACQNGVISIEFGA